MRQNKLFAGVCFGGAGHWACALKNNDIKTTWYYELWKPAVKCFQSNWKDVYVFDDIDEINGDVDIIVGSPHCNGMSNANPKNDINHPANKLMFKFADTIGYIRPNVFIMEESHRLLSSNTFKNLSFDILSKIDDIGYHFNIYILDANDYGSPQRRQRSYIIGFKSLLSQKKFKLPVKIKSCMATKILPKNNKFKVNYDYRPRPRKNEKGLFSMYSNNRLRMIGENCPTITGWTWRDTCHPSGRFLAIPEISAIMGFPRDYIFEGSLARKCSLIGKGVDIRFTTRLLKSVKEVLS